MSGDEDVGVQDVVDVVDADDVDEVDEVVTIDRDRKPIIGKGVKRPRLSASQARIKNLEVSPYSAQHALSFGVLAEQQYTVHRLSTVIKGGKVAGTEEMPIVID